MTTTIVLNLAFAVLGVGGVVGLMRYGHGLAAGRLEPAESLSPNVDELTELKRAA